MKKYRYYTLGFAQGVDFTTILNDVGQRGWQCVSLFTVSNIDPLGGIHTTVGGALLMQEYEEESVIPQNIISAFSTDLPN